MRGAGEGEQGYKKERTQTLNVSKRTEPASAAGPADCTLLRRAVRAPCGMPLAPNPMAEMPPYQAPGVQVQTLG